MNYARTFLSHQSDDKALVMAVADALARRGVVPWLDRHEMYAGQDLTPSLARAIDEHVSITLFLSENALESAWVDDELARALAAEDAGHATVLPVSLGKAVTLVRRHPRLAERWLHADGDRVNRLGIGARGASDSMERAEVIADGIARALYRALGTAAADDLVIVLDQRGDGTRASLPTFVPRSVEALDAPALVFRPDLGERSHGEVLHGDPWKRMAGTLHNALSSALGPRRPAPRKIRIVGNTQLALAFFLGQQLNRTSGAALYCYDRAGRSLSLSLASVDIPLQGGNTACQRDHDSLRELSRVDARTRCDTLTLLVLHDEGYVSKAAAFLAARGTSHPVAWVPHPERIDDAGPIETLARDLAALVARAGARHVELLTSLPVHALPLLAALLAPHAVPRVTFIEYDRNAPTLAECYRAVPLS